MVGAVQQAVREKVSDAEIKRDPFPHMVIPDLLPEEFFRQLEETIPPLEAFESKNDTMSNLPIGDGNEYFEAAPDEFKLIWRQFRDDVLRDTIAPILLDRLQVDIREKFASLFSPEIADEVFVNGLVSKSGRIMARMPGYDLGPHTDPAHFAVTCLLYFTNADDADTGALCFYRPERRPELLTTSTYYPMKDEGIAVELVRGDSDPREPVRRVRQRVRIAPRRARQPLEPGTPAARVSVAHLSCTKPQRGHRPPSRPAHRPGIPPPLATVRGRARQESAEAGEEGGEGAAVGELTSGGPARQGSADGADKAAGGRWNRGGGTRTPGLRFWRPPLYQLSYAPLFGAIVSAVQSRSASARAASLARRGQVAVQSTGNRGLSIGAPAGSSSASPGNSGEVRHARGACVASSPSSGRLATSARSLGSAEVALDPALDERDLVGRERAADAHRAVAPEVVLAHTITTAMLIYLIPVFILGSPAAW